jgi:hypothetical protein
MPRPCCRCPATMTASTGGWMHALRCFHNCWNLHNLLSIAPHGRVDMAPCSYLYVASS